MVEGLTKEVHDDRSRAIGTVENRVIMTFTMTTYSRALQKAEACEIKSLDMFLGFFEKS